MPACKACGVWFVKIKPHEELCDKCESALYRLSGYVAPVRHGPCPYCDAKTNDFITINQTVEYSGIEIALNRQGMLRVRVYESGQETFNAQDIVEIKFCPNCGAKMDMRDTVNNNENKEIG